jgi:thermopsin
MDVRRGPRWAAWGLAVVLVASGLAVAGVAVGGASPSAAGNVASVTSPASISPATSSASATAASAPDGAPATPVAPPPTPLEQKAQSAAAAPREATIDAALSAQGISPRDAFLPDYDGVGATSAGSRHVNLTYTTSPAPYGIGDFGLENVSGAIEPYVTDTTSLYATFNTSYLYGLTPDLSSPDEYGVQVNAVLNNVTLFGDSDYQFWTQNVMEYSPSNQSLVFVSNIWNFSNPTASISCNVFYTAGGTLVCPEFYYGLSREIPASYPYVVQFWMNSTLTQGRDEVLFSYAVSSSAGDFAGTYDYAIFNSLTPDGNPALTPIAEYQANGYHTAVFGLPMDFEITLGGPGGGSDFDVLLARSTYMTLDYLNGTSGTYVSVDSAYNVGGETGETAVGVLADWSSFRGCSNCVLLGNGPSFQYGLWNVSETSAPLGAYDDSPYALIQTDPMSAFVFLAPGADVTDLSEFQWAPDYRYPSAGIVLPVGEYTVILVAAEFDPTTFTIDITPACIAAGCASYTVMTSDSTTGVYTPLWAFNETAVASISSGFDGSGNYLLWNNQYSPIGEIPSFSTYGAAYFPWFGAFNDYMFPVFPGIFLNDTEFVDIATPPSFLTYFPPGPTFQQVVQLIGSPDWNDLQIYVQDSSDVNLLGGTVGGWFPYVSYFGPSTSFAAVTYWNTTDSLIENVAFATGGEALFLYGGSENEIYGNTFTTSIPSSPNPYVTVAAYWGSIGLVDTDWGDAALYGADAWATCDVCDVVANNLFDTDITATQTYYDPYTGGVPDQFPYGFSQAYNGPYTPGTNILGGDMLGGNYWWDFGLGWNPYNVIPYAALNPLPFVENVSDTYAYICESIVSYCDYGGGDFYPLTYSALFTATFEETGLPAGTEWGVGTYVDSNANLLDELEAGIVYNYSFAPTAVDLVAPAGIHEYYPYSANANYAATEGTFTLVDGALTVTVDFAAAYTLTITESGLPAGTTWTATATSPGIEYLATFDGPTITLAGLLPGVYNWTASTKAAYSPVPSVAEITISGDAIATVTFVGQYSLTVTETGLPLGTTWYLSYSSTSGGYSGLDSGTGASITVASLPGVTYNWSVGAAGFSASPPSGAVALSSDTSLGVAFAAYSATGTLSGTITPSSGSLFIDGASVAVGSGGTFSVSLAVGVHSVEVTSSGYASYFNNVSVTSGETTHLAVALTSTTSSATGIGTLGWLLIAVLAVVAAVLLVTTLLFARRGRQPPPVAPYQPPPAAVTGPPPPAWQEPPPPPPGS